MHSQAQQPNAFLIDRNQGLLKMRPDAHLLLDGDVTAGHVGEAELATPVAGEGVVDPALGRSPPRGHEKLAGNVIALIYAAAFKLKNARCKFVDKLV